MCAWQHARQQAQQPELRALAPFPPTLLLWARQECEHAVERQHQRLHGQWADGGVREWAAALASRAWVLKGVNAVACLDMTRHGVTKCTSLTISALDLPSSKVFFEKKNSCIS
mmetsp:Transcript_21163/g.31019  ORF Transcript_21163/g.31019 Transcript_21163/m.31019 type:complete len:113 (+) Transcript_21163:59-397(+)